MSPSILVGAVGCIVIIRTIVVLRLAGRKTWRRGEIWGNELLLLAGALLLVSGLAGTSAVAQGASIVGVCIAILSVLTVATTQRRRRKAIAASPGTISVSPLTGSTAEVFAELRMRGWSGRLLSILTGGAILRRKPALYLTPIAILGSGLAPSDSVVLLQNVVQVSLVHRLGTATVVVKAFQSSDSIALAHCRPRDAREFVEKTNSILRS